MHGQQNIKICPYTARRHIGVEVRLHSFLASELDEGDRPQALAALPPEKQPLLLI